MRAARTYAVLTPRQERMFLEKGYLVVEECLDRDLALRWTDEAFRRLGYDPADPATWEKDLVWMDHANTKPVSEISERAWGAICDVVGGAERLDTRVWGLTGGHFTSIDSFVWSDAFIVNFHRGRGEPWVPPSPAARGWHKDGSYFRHYLDSREQSLLTVLLWSDVEPRGGGTFLATDSVRVVARYLHDHPEGVEPDDFPRLVDRCREFVEITGPVGTFAILHPFMLHASSNNHSGRARFMTNPPVILRDPMNLNREDPADFSLLERATLHALGLERLDFRPTTPRRSDWWQLR